MIPGMRVLLVTMYWPPAGGAGVQRPLKFAEHLAELGFDVHVLAPDDPKWLHRDASLVVAARGDGAPGANLGPRSRRPAEELRAAPRARRGSRCAPSSRRGGCSCPTRPCSGT